MTLERLTRMHKEFERDGRAAEFVLVTLDPTADTVDDLRRFKRSSGLPAAWHLLRGTSDETQALADFLRLKIMNDGTHIVHEAKIAVVGADGRLMGHVRG